MPGAASLVLPCRHVLGLLAAAAIALGCDAAARSPDVVLIVLDTTRADALSCYGGEAAATPHIDGLAAEGALFLAATSVSPWTCPSVASIFTGLLPSQHGLHLEHLGLLRDRVTIAELLAEAGYQTAAFSNNPFLSGELGLGQGFEHFHDVWREVTPEQLRSDDPGGKQTNRLLAEWLDTERDPSRPLFLLMHYMEPHLPYHPPEPFASAFLGDGVDQATARGLMQMPVLAEMGYIVGQYTLSAEQLAVLRSLYHADVAYTDQLVGELLALLRERSLVDGSLLILTSDHGENLGEHHLLDHKFCVYQTLLEVPLIVRHPPSVPAGLRVAEPVQTTDLFATIAEAAGLELPPDPRRSPSLLGPRSADRAVHAQHYRPSMFMDALRGAYPGIDVSRFDRRLASVQVGSTKLIWSSDGRHELYDLSADPGEETDLLGVRPDLASELERRLVPLR